MLVVVFVFLLKLSGSSSNEKIIAKLGPEPEKVYEVNCSGGMTTAAVTQIGLLKGEITEQLFSRLNEYSNEYEIRTAKALVKANMSESEAIILVKQTCFTALYKYNAYQRAKDVLKYSK